MGKNRKVVSLDAYRQKKLAAAIPEVHSALVEAEIRKEFLRHIKPALDILLTFSDLPIPERERIALQMANQFVILRLKAKTKKLL